MEFSVVKYSEIDPFIPEVTVERDDKLRCFTFVGDKIGYFYHVSYNRCDTPSKILGWCDHLKRKTWFDTYLLDSFIQLAFERIGVRKEYP